jgi:hypothetical protein
LAVAPHYPDYDALDDDDLLGIGAELESRLLAIQTELESLEPDVLAERRRIRKSGIKLGINALLGLAGVGIAPVTFGWSLILTFGCTGMVVWDGIDYVNDYVGHGPERRRLRELRLAAKDLADELGTIHAVLETRYRQ